MVIFLDITEVLSGKASVSHEGPSHPTEKVRQPSDQRMAFSPLFGDAKLQRKVESNVKSFGFGNAAKLAILPHVLTLFQSFDPMAGNAERVLTLYAPLWVKTNNRLLTL